MHWGELTTEFGINVLAWTAGCSYCFMCVVSSLWRWLPWTMAPCIHSLVWFHSMLVWGQPSDWLYPIEGQEAFAFAPFWASSSWRERAHEEFDVPGMCMKTPTCMLQPTYVASLVTHHPSPNWDFSPKSYNWEVWIWSGGGRRYVP